MKKLSIIVLLLLSFGIARAYEFSRIEERAGDDPYVYQTISATEKYPSWKGGAVFFDHSPSSTNPKVPMAGVGGRNLFPADSENGTLDFLVKKAGKLVRMAWVDPGGLNADRMIVRDELKAQKITTTEFGGPGQYEPKFGGEMLFTEKGAPIASTPFGQRASIMMFNHTANTSLGSALYIVSRTAVPTSSAVAKNAITLHCEHQPDNGYDSSCISSFQAGGANAGTFYTLPFAFGQNIASSSGIAVEAATDGGGVALFGAAGSKFSASPTPNRSTAVWGRVDNQVSVGFLATPGDSVFDDRTAYAVGRWMPNSEPQDISYEVKMNGFIKTKSDVYITDPMKGVILSKQGGGCVRITLDSLGEFIKTNIPCP